MKTLVKITLAAAALAAVSTSVTAKPFGQAITIVQTVPAWLPQPFPRPLPDPKPIPRPDPVCLSCPPIDFGNVLIDDTVYGGSLGGQFGLGY